MADSQIRITSHGKLKHWVTYSLEFLSKNAEIPLVLHTLPPPDSKSTTSSVVTKTIPKLITAVEIIKREFIKALDGKHSTRLVGLHQYNEIGNLEDLEKYSRPETEETRSEAIARALQGKAHPKQVQTPFMRVTLSLRELPELVAKGASYQPPVARQLSKGQKTRAKKKQKKLDVAALNAEEAELSDPVPD